MHTRPALRAKIDAKLKEDFGLSLELLPQAALPRSAATHDAATLSLNVGGLSLVASASETATPLTSRAGGGGGGGGGGGEGGRETLPYADPLPTDVARKAAPTAALFGEACARCLFSKGWALREAALLHIEHELRKMGSGVDDEVAALAIEIVEAALLDHVVHIFHSALSLLLTVVRSSAHCSVGLSDEVVHDCITSFRARPRGSERLREILHGICPRLGDSNARISTAAKVALLNLSQQRSVRDLVLEAVLDSSKAWANRRAVLLGRLELLGDANVRSLLCADSDGDRAVRIDLCMVAVREGLDSQSKRVRECASELFLALHAAVRRIATVLIRRNARRRTLVAFCERIHRIGRKLD